MAYFPLPIFPGLNSHGTIFCATAVAVVLSMQLTGRAEVSQTAIQSPDGRNSIVVDAARGNDGHVQFAISRDGRKLLGPSPLGPVLAAGPSLGTGARIVD